ncbi:MAG: hypothetical protein AABY22_20315 [Nanoarchaeota archaeon]
MKQILIIMAIVIFLSFLVWVLSLWYPFGTKFRLTYMGNTVTVECTDHGNFKDNPNFERRFLDISSSSFEVLAPLSKGVLGVTIEEIK